LLGQPGQGGFGYEGPSVSSAFEGEATRKTAKRPAIRSGVRKSDADHEWILALPRRCYKAVAAEESWQRAVSAILLA